MAPSRPTIFPAPLMHSPKGAPEINSVTGATNWYPLLGNVSMNSGLSRGSPSALRIPRIYFLMTSGFTYVSGHNAASNSSCVTRRTIRISVPNTAVSTNATITANVAPGPGNTGSPTGTVTFLDGSTRLGSVPLVSGSASLDAIFADAGIHAITAQYSGDRIFLPRSERIPLQVTGIATTSTLIAPADATPGSTIILTANINSDGGIPTGQVAFLDGTTNLGTSPLNGSGVAVLRISIIAAGAHSLTAAYSGDEKFGVTTSPARIFLSAQPLPAPR